MNLRLGRTVCYATGLAVMAVSCTDSSNDSISPRVSTPGAIEIFAPGESMLTDEAVHARLLEFADLHESDRDFRDAAIGQYCLQLVKEDGIRFWEIVVEVDSSGYLAEKYFNAWVTVFPAEALDYLSFFEDSIDLIRQFKLIAARGLSDANGRALLDRLASTESNTSLRKTLFSIAISHLVAAGKLAEASEILPEFTPRSQEWRESVGLIGASLFQKNPSELVTWIQSMPDSERMDAFHLVLGSPSSGDPEISRSREKLVSLLTPELSEELLDVVVAHLVSRVVDDARTPEDALSVVRDTLSNVNVDASNAEAWLLSGLAAGMPKETLAYISQSNSIKLDEELVEQLARAFAVDDPLTAVEWVETLTEPGFRSIGQMEIFNWWIHKDSESVSAWVGSLPIGSERDRMASSLVALLVKSGDFESASHWASFIENSDLRSNNLDRIENAKE